MSINSPEEFADAGSKAYQEGDYLEAVQHFDAAVHGFKAQDKELKAAEMANNQSVALLQAGEAQAALDVVEGTDRRFENAGDRLHQAMALGNTAAALDALDRIEDAETAYSLSANLFEELGESELHANVIQAHSKMQLRSGRQIEALETMQTGLGKIKHPSLRQRMLKKLLKAPYKLFKR